VEIGRAYSKSDFIGRWRNDRLYGHAVAAQIAALRPDVVISGNTPLDAQGAIIAATHSAGGAFVNWIQDYYSLAIDKLIAGRWAGLGRAIAARYRTMETRQLAASDAVVLISEDFGRTLTGFEHRPDRIAVIPNWGPIEGIPVRAKANAWSRRHGLADRFVFLYSGTLALKHNPDILVALADAFADRPEVAVVVAASGVGRDRLDGVLATKPRANLVTLPLQPFPDFADMLGSADVLVAVLEADAGQFSAPSKVLSYLCAARPVLLSAPLDNIVSRMITQVRAGVVTAPADTKGLIAAAERLYADAVSRRAMGERARAHAEASFAIDRIADRFEAVFRKAVEPKPSPASPVLAFVHLPPPLHGVSVVSRAMVDWIARLRPVQVINLSYGGFSPSFANAAAYLRPQAAVLGALLSLRVRRRQSCYVSLSGGLRQAFDLLVAALAKARGLRMIVHHHSRAYVTKRSMMTAAFCRLLRPDDVMIFLGEDHRDGFAQLYAPLTQCLVISNAAVVPMHRRCERACAPSMLRIGFLANLELAKGIDVFFAVVRALTDQGLAVRAVVAGPFRDEACRPLVTRAIDEGFAEYLGPVDGPEKQAFFEAIDIFVFPSRYRDETEPMVVLEAMAQGVPVVASAVGCLRAMLPKGFALTLSGHMAADAATMAQTIRRVAAGYACASRAMLVAFDRRRAASFAAQAALRALLETA
jgi:glycosyltransferase involved in cell wall biosynthesis